MVKTATYPCHKQLGKNNSESTSTSSHGHNHNMASQCSYSRIWLMQVVKETLNIGCTGKYQNSKGEWVDISECLHNALENTVHYHQDEILTLKEGKIFDKTEYYIGYMSSLEAAAKLKDGSSHIGILNSASSKTPGGRFDRGTMSQEDVICRSSLLYFCLMKYYNLPNHYYQINQSIPGHGKSSSCAIFCERVPVIRKDNKQAPLLDDYQVCSFVNIPAPNAFVIGRPLEGMSSEVATKSTRESREKEQLKFVRFSMYERLFKALCIFANHGCTEIILCAFGCGVHGNSPTMVAEIFREILSTEMKGRFRKVVFAIHLARTQNYKAFKNVFPETVDI